MRSLKSKLNALLQLTHLICVVMTSHVMCCRMYCYRIWTLLILMLILIISNNFVVLKSHGIWFELDVSGISGNGTTGSGSGGDNRTAAAWIRWWRWCSWHVKRIGRGQHIQIHTEYPHVRFRFCVCVVLLLKYDKIVLKIRKDSFVFFHLLLKFESGEFFSWDPKDQKNPNVTLQRGFVWSHSD